MTVFKKLVGIASAMIFGFAATAFPVRAIDQAKPGENAPAAAPMAQPDAEDHAALAKKYARQNRAAFDAAINLDKLRLLGVQTEDQVKILDSWARQSLRKIRRRQTIDGKDSLFTALDIAFRPEAWAEKEIIYVESPPIRELLAQHAANPAEGKRITESGLVSPAFIMQAEVMQQLRDAGNNAVQTEAVNKVFNAAGMFVNLYSTLNVVPPPADHAHDPWLHPEDLAKEVMSTPSETPSTAPAALFSRTQQADISEAFGMLQVGWQGNDVKTANAAIDRLATLLPAINPEVYPTRAKALTELWYNRTFSGTLVAIIYFAAMVLFFLIAVGVAKRGGRVAKFAFSIYGFALFCHLAAMGVRWWLNGRIPIQNMFESVMGSAALGCCVGLALESWKKNGIFGTAFGFVGFLAATTLLASPYVFGRDLGSDPGKVAGILDTYWLYIHVNIVIASYALIFATAVIGAIYLLRRQWHWINPIEPGSESTGDSHGGGSGPRNTRKSGGATTPALALSTSEAARITTERALALDTLDQANMVVLQMAFWFLGVGIICGAIWADHSWGRPWGWDPKETFALVTWMVYLIIVHLRLVTKHKADWTAWLAIAGCGVMLFNWIGVNFFLKGLHSYA